MIVLISHTVTCTFNLPAMFFFSLHLSGNCKYSQYCLPPPFDLLFCLDMYLGSSRTSQVKYLMVELASSGVTSSLNQKCCGV